tara:strand:- start:3480 stop:5084 length:1605 start_codon:yes stop_codon:yes gene_type:complete
MVEQDDDWGSENEEQKPRGETEHVQHVDEVDHTTTPEETDQEESDGGDQDEQKPRGMKYSQREDVPESPNFSESKPPRSKLEGEPTKRHITDALLVLMEHPDYAVEMLSQLREDDVTEDRAEYFRQVQEAMRNHAALSEVNPFNRPDSDWKHGLEDGQSLVSAGRVRLNSSGGKLSGDSARLRLRAATGLGSILSIPLWHTGLWVKIKTPSAATLVELERTIAQQKAAIGRSTSGVAFSNSTIFILEPLLNCIFRHVYEHTYKGEKELRDIVKVTDIPQLVWGFACSIYPDGFPFAQPCVANPRKCTHVDYTTLHVPKLSWLDNTSMSEYQSRLMVDRDGEVTDETLSEYTRQHKAPQSRRVSINEDVTIHLSVPTVARHIQSGNSWVDGIIEMTNEAFGQELRGRQRDNYIIEQSQVTQLRRYTHWIEKVEFSDGSFVSDADSIDDLVSDLSSDPDIRDLIVENVEWLIKNSVISAVGIPRYDCPECGGVASEDDSVTRLSEIIQLEVLEVFFTLGHTRAMTSVRRGGKRETS